MKKLFEKSLGWILLAFGVFIIIVNFIGKGSFSFVMLIIGLAFAGGGWYLAKPANKRDKEFYEDKKNQGNLYENIKHIDGKISEDSSLLAGDTDFIVTSDKIYIFASDSLRKIAEIPFDSITYLWSGVVEDKGMNVSSMTNSAHMQKAALTGQSIVGTAVAIKAVDALTESWFQHHLLKLSYQEANRPVQLVFESTKTSDINKNILSKMNPAKLNSLNSAKKAKESPANNDVAEQLKKLSDLKVSGVISDQDFEYKKKELLARM